MSSETSQFTSGECQWTGVWRGITLQRDVHREEMPVTEAEWLHAADPLPMLEFVRGKASDRKLRLFSCACARRFWLLLADAHTRAVVRVSERYADGLRSRKELDSVAEGASVGTF
jgi:hypothetical protein